MANWVNWCSASLECDARYFYKDLFSSSQYMMHVKLKITGKPSASSTASLQDYSDWSKHQDELTAWKPSLVLVDAVSGEEIRMGAGKILDVCASNSSWAKGQTRSNRAADKVWIKGKKQKEGQLMLEACYIFKCRVCVLSSKNQLSPRQPSEKELQGNFRLRVELPADAQKRRETVLSEVAGIKVLARPQKPNLLFEYLPRHTVGELKDLVYVLCGVLGVLCWHGGVLCVACVCSRSVVWVCALCGRVALACPTCVVGGRARW